MYDSVALLEEDSYSSEVMRASWNTMQYTVKKKYKCLQYPLKGRSPNMGYFFVRGGAFEIKVVKR